MTHNHSLFRSLCTQRWTRACSLSPEAPSFWLAFQAGPALCMHMFVKVQCSTLGSTLDDKCFSFFSTDWRWQWWRTSNSAVTAFIAKRPRVAYSCSYVLLAVTILSLSAPIWFTMDRRRHCTVFRHLMQLSLLVLRWKSTLMVILPKIKKKKSLSNVGHRGTKAENFAWHPTG